MVTEGEDVVFTLTWSTYGQGDSLTVQVQVVESGWQGSDVVDLITDRLGVVSTVTDIDVEFEAGSRTATLTRSTVDETINDGNSRMAATIKLGFYALREGTHRAEVWIRDDDLATVTIDTGTVERRGTELGYSPSVYADGERTYDPRTIIDSGIDEIVEDAGKWPGIVLSRTSDTTHTLGVPTYGYGLHWWPGYVYVTYGDILMSGDLHSGRYDSTVDVEDAFAGNLLPPWRATCAA